MFRIFHGESLPLDPEEVTEEEPANLAEGVPALVPPSAEPMGGVHAPASVEFVEDVRAPSPPPAQSKEWRFDYLFPKLHLDPENFLPPTGEPEKTVENLRGLGKVMKDPGDVEAPSVPIPTIYTFFGQFVDHDITLEKAPPEIKNLTDLTPLSSSQVRYLISNIRSPNLELDSVYSPYAPWDPMNRDKMLLGEVNDPNSLPCGKDKYNDLPRGPIFSNPRFDRVALIGDPRNDENLIIAQLHVAFLRAHNELIDQGCTFEQARKLLVQHYQWIVLHDFLERIADPMIVKKIRNEGATFFTPTRESLFIPLEFSAAAYRFGHSKVRDQYNDYNEIQKVATLSMLFTFTRFGGELRAGPKIFTQITGDWVIDWTNFVNPSYPDYFTRPIDTTIAETLLNIDMQHGVPIGVERNLATRNLLRGHILNLPTGQAVARRMQEKVAGIIPLEKKAIVSVVTAQQLPVLEAAGFLDKTPLWFYILAEAAFYSRGYHLGPVGSTIVAETLIGILKYSDYSILSETDWRPSLGLNPGKFDLSDLLKLAGVF